MTFPLPQLEFTADYIVNQCKYKNLKPLNFEDKIKATALLLQALNEIHLSNPHYIIINPDPEKNHQFIDFFTFLAKANILFPEKTDYKLMREGITYQRTEDKRKVIYNHHKIKKKAAKGREQDMESDLEAQLRSLSFDYDSADEEESSETERLFTPHRDSFKVPIDTFIVQKTSEKKLKRHSY